MIKKISNANMKDYSKTGVMEQIATADSAKVRSHYACRFMLTQIPPILLNRLLTT